LEKINIFGTCLIVQQGSGRFFLKQKDGKHPFKRPDKHVVAKALVAVFQEESSTPGSCLFVKPSLIFRAYC